MYDPDAKFDLAWTPPKYPSMNVDDNGVWRHVKDQDDESVGLVWSNRKDASGVVWVTQTDAVTSLYKYFSRSAQGNIPAFAAYVNAADVHGVRFGPEQSGKLSDAREDLQAMEDDLDEAQS